MTSSGYFLSASCDDLFYSECRHICTTTLPEYLTQVWSNQDYKSDIWGELDTFHTLNPYFSSLQQRSWTITNHQLTSTFDIDWLVFIKCHHFQKPNLMSSNVCFELIKSRTREHLRLCLKNDSNDESTDKIDQLIISTVSDFSFC